MTNAQKTWWIVVIAIVLVVLLVVAVKGSDDRELDEGRDDERSMEDRVASTTARLKSATILMPDTYKPITLVDGRTSFTPAGSASEVNVELLDLDGGLTVVKDVHAGTALARTDVLTVANIEYGGSGSYRYLVLLKDDGANLEMKSIALIGDRVNVEDVTVDDLAGIDGEEYIVTVEYLDREEGAPMSDRPTVEKKKFFIVENGGFNLAKTDLENIEGKD